MVWDRAKEGVNRRTLLIGGGVGAGLLVAWAAWPRTYLPNLSAGPGETVFGAWLKIGGDGQVTVAVPQTEHGQGVYTTLPQIVADELGADWRTVGVEAAPLNPLYANPLAMDALFEGLFDGVPEAVRKTHAARTALVLTAGSSSVRRFESDLREAGAAARVLLCMAAAKRWNTDWQTLTTADGFVVRGKERLRFGELAAEAAGGTLPDTLPLRVGPEGRLYGESVPRLDVPAKVDGSANFAGDIRLPGMVFAAIRQGPVGTIRLAGIDEPSARKVSGLLHVVRNERWVAAVARNWWAASKAVDALAPRFEVGGPTVDSTSIAAALDGALAGEGVRVASAGNLGATFKGARVVTADYRVGLAVHAPLETTTATAHYVDGRLRLWLPTQAPGLARAAAARTIGIGEDRVTVYPMLAGGSFGARLEHQVAEQAALLAREIGKPVQLTWSRTEDLLHDRYRPPAAARMTARLAPNGMILGWLAKIAAPETGRELAHRLMGADTGIAAALALGSGDASALAGAVPVYSIPNYAVDHHPAAIGVPTGHWRSGAHSYTAFFTESFLDELAHVANIEAHSFRIAMLGGDVRLARCLSTVATLGGWQGGVPGSGQGLACHSFRGSHIAVMAEASIGMDQRIKVDRIVAAVDCGRMVNPDVVLQQIEGGLLFGMAAALGASTGFTGNIADVRGLGDLGLPGFGDAPDITVELIDSEADPGGVSELAVPPIAPAIANAIHAATGIRLRSLPLTPGGA
jgi:isoquinoline 1-oxidoreductase beta subunit